MKIRCSIEQLIIIRCVNRNSNRKSSINTHYKTIKNETRLSNLDVTNDKMYFENGAFFIF